MSYAQNWALINPAYKYNYSNDGSDTISNQIFVTEVDTLGPDSFQFALNRIATQCDTCWSGSSCVGCGVLSDQPQFLMRSVVVSSGAWRFIDPDTFLVRTDAAIGDTWVCHGSVTAELDTIIEGSILGQVDSMQVIQLSNGDSIVISRSFGIYLWPPPGGSASPLGLIGVQGIGVGAQVPSLQEIFGLQPGDVVVYDREYGDAWGGFLLTENHSSMHKHTIQTRSEAVDHVEFTITGVGCSGSSFQYSGPPYFSSSYDCSGGSGPWTLPSDDDWPWDDLPFEKLIRSYPGQLILDSTFEDHWNVPLWIVAEHLLDENGRYVVRARKFNNDLGETAFCFLHPEEDQPGAYWGGYDWGIEQNGVAYSSRIGLIAYNLDNGESSEHFVLTGSVIDGDTTGDVPSDSQLLDLQEVETDDHITIYVDPASGQLQIQGKTASFAYAEIHDMAGRSVLRSSITRLPATVDVNALHGGAYLFRLVTPAGSTTQRFIIAR